MLEAVGGGTALHLRTLSAAQVAAGHEVTAALPSRRSRGYVDHGLSGELARQGVLVEAVALRRAPTHPGNVAAAARLAFLVQRLRPDIVHTHSTAAGAVARPVACALGATVVHTPNGVRFADAARSPVGEAAHALERVLSRATSRVIAASESEGAVLAQAYPWRKVVVVPNGIPAGDAPGAAPASPRVVAVNRLVYQKDPEAVVRIMAEVRRRRPGTEAVVVGEGPLARRVRAMAARLDPAIRITAERPGADAVAGASVVLLASRWEGGPYVPLEAMRAARPVVASDVVGSRDVVVHGETGFLYERGAEGDGAARVAWLLDHPEEATRMGLAGRRRLEARYGLEPMARGVLAVYAEALADAPVSARGALRRPR